MSIIHNYCITGKYYHFLNDLNVNVVISGAENKDCNIFPPDWNKDNVGKNISYKNKNFGTLTFHYWLWKNKLHTYKDDDWIGINHYRRFWIKEDSHEIDNVNLSENILRKIPENKNFDVLLPEKIFLRNLKLSKLIKHGLRNILTNPGLLFNRHKISISLHFDLFHGYNLLKRSCKFIDEEDRLDFLKYINNNTSFHPLELFISKKKIINKLYEKTFRWIFKCENEFQDLKLEGYGKERLYDFLAERFFSFYFEKYTKIKSWPYILIENKYLS